MSKQILDPIKDCPEFPVLYTEGNINPPIALTLPGVPDNWRVRLTLERPDDVLVKETTVASEVAQIAWAATDLVEGERQLMIFELLPPSPSTESQTLMNALLSPRRRPA